MLKYFAALCVLVASTTTATAWDNPERVRAIYVNIHDDVIDGCWPRPQATRDAVELVFRQAGIKIAENNFSWFTADGSTASADDTDVHLPHHFKITITGEGRVDSCTVAVVVKLERIEHLSRYDQLNIVRYYLASGYLAGAKSRMQRRITESATEQATSLANAILAARAEAAEDDWRRSPQIPEGSVIESVPEAQANQ